MEYKNILEKMVVETDGLGHKKKMTLVLEDESDIDELIAMFSIPEVSLDDLDLSVRTRNCLARWFLARHDLEPEKVSVDMVKALIENDDIYRVKNLGKKGVQEVIKAVR
ncbi:MAG: hypothetical protein K5765_06990 [Clostridia bacterium]|nr:hypothetical protein [Clostridia bacterium]